MSFNSTIDEFDYNEKNKISWCAAKNCPLGKEKNGAHYVCEFHEITDPIHWRQVTQRIYKYSWLIKIMDQMFTRRTIDGQSLPGWITDDEIESINKKLTEKGFDDLLVSRDPRTYHPSPVNPDFTVEHIERPYDYGLRIQARLLGLIVPPEYRHGGEPIAFSVQQSVNAAFDEVFDDDFLKHF